MNRHTLFSAVAATNTVNIGTIKSIMHIQWANQNVYAQCQDGCIQLTETTQEHIHCKCE